MQCSFHLKRDRILKKPQCYSNSVIYIVYIIVLVTYVTVKRQATRKKPWRQGENTPTILQMEKLRKEEKS